MHLKSGLLYLDAEEDLVVLGLDGPPEEGPAAGADSAAVVAVLARLLPANEAQGGVLLAAELLGRGLDVRAARRVPAKTKAGFVLSCAP